MWPWKFHTLPSPPQDWNDINTEGGLQLPKHGVLFQLLSEYFLTKFRMMHYVPITSQHWDIDYWLGLEQKIVSPLNKMGNCIIVLNFKHKKYLCGLFSPYRLYVY